MRGGGEVEKQRTMVRKEAYIAGIGSYSPGEPVPFDKIEEVLGKLTDAPAKLLERIERMRPIMKEMLGVTQCHYALDPKTRKPTDDNVTMSCKSARKALEQAGLEPASVDLLMYAGIMMEYVCPPTSVLIQEELKIPCCADIAIHSNCTSIYKAIQVAADFVALGRYQHALLTTAQLSSAFLRAEYYNQKVLQMSQVLLRWFLSDAAGALVITSDPTLGTNRFRIVDTYIDSRGLGLGPDMYCRVGGHRSQPLEIYENGWHHLAQNFEQVARLAPELGRKAFDAMVEKSGLDTRTVKYVLLNVPTKHVNDEAIRVFVEERHMDHAVFYTKLSQRGYPGPCAIIHALEGLLQDYTLVPGDIVVSIVAESSKWMYGGFILEYVG
jgi:3-oxoacyl-[acyl-carrier-protein] synthase III